MIDAAEWNAARQKKQAPEAAEEDERNASTTSEDEMDWSLTLPYNTTHSCSLKPLKSAFGHFTSLNAATSVKKTNIVRRIHGRNIPVIHEFRQVYH